MASNVVETEIDMQWALKVPMRDGVRLNATLFKPKGLKRKIPAIFTMTPYVADTWHRDAVYFARHGYVFLVFDVRGRGNSEGTFSLWGNEAQDGYEIVEWLSRQAWCNGKIGMWGGSYSGNTQWLVAGRLHPHLRTIVPTVSGCATVQITSPDWHLALLQWLTMISGVTDNLRVSTDQQFWIEKLRELYLSHLPCRDFDRVWGNTSTMFQKCLDHPTPDGFWNAMVPSKDQYASMNLPILTITGHYDICNRLALHHYLQHMRYASSSARSRHYLVIGPWDHHGAREPSKEIGGARFGDASLLDMNRLLKEWYDWTLKAGRRPEFLKKRVAYYMEGTEEWRYADGLDAVSKKKYRLHLDSDHGEANDAFHSGFLRRQVPRMSSSDRYVFDPLDTRPADIEDEEIKNYNTDQRYCLNLFGNGLVYHSDPSAEDMEIAGSPRFVAWIAMDVPDADFLVRLFEIRRDGSSIALANDTVRARHRKSLTNQELIEPNVINRYEFGRFQFFARRISKGSRIRLVVSCPNSIYYQKNYNSGGVVADESAEDALTAHVRLYHNKNHLSFLELPIAV